jgi:hypothetical protein
MQTSKVICLVLMCAIALAIKLMKGLRLAQRLAG